jgi:peptidoglycan/LPS O-acetylase OafA/YrhL
MPKRIPQLDAVRGIAILLVILHNESSVLPSLHLQRLLANGWMGVDLFFVLSGMLITGILLDTKESSGYFRNFYARRCLRIWPLYYSLIVFMFVIVPVLRPSEAHTVFDKSSPWWAYPLFLQNFLIRMPTNAAGPLAVTWSLAIEEQFYLVWPWIVRYRSRAQVGRLAILVIGVSPALRLYLSVHDVNLYTNIFCRLDGLMAGALLALALRSDAWVADRFVRWASMVLVVSLSLAFATEAANARWIVFSLSAAASASFVYLALFSQQAWLHWALTNRFLVYTGGISYGLYLLHKIPFDLEKSVHFDRHPLLALPILLAACYGMAALSWNLLEKPFLKLKRYFVEEVPDSRKRSRDPVLSQHAKHLLDGFAGNADQAVDLRLRRDQRRCEEDGVAGRRMDADRGPRPRDDTALDHLGF